MADIPDTESIDSTKENLSNQDLLILSKRQYEEGGEYWNPMHEKGRDDIDFLNGDNHWPEQILKERENDNRPSLVINHAPKYLRQVVGDQRQNRPQAKVRPFDGESDKDIAFIYEGLLRNIEYISNFKTVQDTAFRHSAGNGFGYIRIVTEFTDDDAFEQEIKYKRVVNPFSVTLDPNAKEMDHSDGMFAFYTEWIKREEYRRRYPGKALTDFKTSSNTHEVEWHKEDQVLIAEWFRRVPVKKTLGLLSNGKVINMEGVQENKIEPEIDGTPVTVVRTKEVDSFKTLRYLVSGSDVLEEGKEFPSPYIPIVPIWGEEILREDGRRDFNSVIRFMKDPNRMYEFMRSAEVEQVALVPKAPYLGTPAMFEGHETAWNQANRKNAPYLNFNIDPDSPMAKPSREAPPQVSSGINAAAMMAKEDMKDTTGQYDAGEAITGEVSGKAILARQREGDVSTYTWIDNLTVGITQVAKIAISMIPRIYDTDRQIRIRNIDDTEEFIKINQVAGQDKEGKDILVNDLSVGKYDVIVETGPSYSTQRVESSESMIAFAQAMGPQAAGVIADLVAKNQDWPGASEISDRLKKLLPPGMVELEEGEEPPAPPPPPEPTPQDEIENRKLGIEEQKIELANKKLEIEFEQMKIDARKLVEEDGLTEEEVKMIVLQTLQEVNQAQTPGR